MMLVQGLTESRTRSFENSLFQYVPIEIMKEIFLFLASPSVFNCQMVCKTWHAILMQHNALWGIFCKQLQIQPKANQARQMYQIHLTLLKSLDLQARQLTSEHTIISLAANQNYLVVGNSIFQVLVWDSDDLKKINQWSLSAEQRPIYYQQGISQVFINQNQIFAISSYDHDHLYQISLETGHSTLFNKDKINFDAFDEQGEMTIVSENQITIYHVDSPAEHYKTNFHAINTFKFNNHLLALADIKGTCELWDLKIKQCIKTLKVPSEITHLDLSDDCLIIVEGVTKQKHSIIHFTSLANDKSCKLTTERIKATAIFHRFLITGDFKGQVRLWSMDTYKIVHELNIKSKIVAFTINGNHLIIATKNQVLVYDANKSSIKLSGLKG